jgi:hypothetical protein
MKLCVRVRVKEREKCTRACMHVVVAVVNFEVL